MKTFIKKQFPINRNLRFRECIGNSFLASIASALLLSAATTQATNLTVTSASDSGAGTLRQAILNASSGDTINFAAGITTITLLSGELLIDKNLTINGPGANLLTVQTPAHTFRIFDIASPTITAAISGLTITNGGAYEGNNYGGAGIHNGGALTITNCTISGNYSGNGAHGGGHGGGIMNGGVLTITNSTISGNWADWDGGAIFNYGLVTIANCTISGNGCCGGRGGGGAVENSGNMTITNSTISGNTHFGGLYNVGNGTVTARSTIIALNTAIPALGGTPYPSDVSGALTSQGFNVIGTNAGATITPPQSSDQIGTPGSPIDPLLGPLQNNGGPTLTMALLAGSPAINTGDPNAPPQDQRGYGRVGVPDVGAFEFGGVSHPAFFNGETALGNGVYYLQFPNGIPFGYYVYLSDPRFIYHFDMGYEYWFDANDGHSGIFFYDFASNHFFYTSPSFPFPFLYDFSLNTVLYYYPDPSHPGHYTTNPRYFYNFATGQIITM